MMVEELKFGSQSKAKWKAQFSLQLAFKTYLGRLQSIFCEWLRFLEVIFSMGRLIWFCLSLIFEIYEKAENNDKTQVIQITVFAYRYEQKMSDHNNTKVSK